MWTLIESDYFIFLVLFLLISTNPNSVNCSPQVSELSSTTSYELDGTTPEMYEDINSNIRKSEIFEQLLETGSYDTKVRPPGINGTGPTDIFVSLYIRSIQNIDDTEMQYTVQMTFRQQWIDPRLNYSHIQNNIHYLQLVKPERIWTPDIFFSNEKKGLLHVIMRPNVFTRIFPDGLVIQSYRITLTLSCPMNLHSYPMDSQSCPIQMASYGWTTDDLMLNWLPEEPIQMASEFRMPRFKLRNYVTKNCSSNTSTGNYGCIKLQLRFTREFGFYLIQIYVPCSMLVVVSWVSFWLEPTAVEARVSLGVTTILTIVTQTYGINMSVPPASYVKALDIWTAACQIMVFAALLQFSLVNYISHFQWVKAPKKPLVRHAKIQQEKSNTGILNQISQTFKRVPVAETENMQLTKLPQCQQTKEDGSDDTAAEEEREAERASNFSRKAKRIDIISRILFPMGFLIFNITYWSTFLVTLNDAEADEYT